MAKEVDFSLGRKDILRGFNSFQNVFEQQTSLGSDNFVIYFHKEEVHRAAEGNNDIKSPSGSKAGFIVSKKKVRKSVNRNKLKRYLRELYRLNKPVENKNENLSVNLSMIISFSDAAIAEFSKEKKLDISKMNSEFKNLIMKVLS